MYFKALIKKFQNDLKDHPTDSKRAHKWAHYTMDCYLTAVYEEIWKERNNHTFNTIIEGENIIQKRTNDAEDEIEQRCTRNKILETEQWWEREKREQTDDDAILIIKKRKLHNGQFINIRADAD